MMATNDYHFITRWRMQSTLDEINEIIGNAPDLVRWWPSVYLDVKELERGDARGLGKVISLFTKGWLPYTLRWQFKVTEVNTPHGFRLDAAGDFVGHGIWTFEQDGDFVNITYDWKISAEKGLLKTLSFIMKPIFSANHRWAMRKGEESLKLELQRRHAKTAEERARVPVPPQPTFAWTIKQGSQADQRATTNSVFTS
ncbi:MAG: hypothetical protein KatS3mg053_3183 [Candidatus Roseilinea sp.]|nr:MAG: hypothetical protein KatS3mg053_3183 [Candidatus Roseilinea sp.]